MKTTTVRLDDDLARLLELAARLDGCRTSDLVRVAVSDLIVKRAETHPELARKRDVVAADRLAAAQREISETWGVDPEEVAGA